ncbi:MAG: signal transduction protein [Candidatus Scalindua rubra]|uniref:Signal transduction protein n=1 Tax=Candidatus Scalindua rubra TaxID=1872076 RepID=A0A1E3XF22_9BACT|nr:MAG: signal transduction protein [Candidatus Scalindua rubra]
MRKILFVDDDQKVIQELKGMLHPMRYEWDMEFAGSGKDALKSMEKSSFDVVVSDMDMPEIDGVKLLDIVMERYPATVRIMHSENSDRAMTMRSVECTHQFLMKPCDVEIMKYTIERTYKLQNLLRNETLVKTVTGIKDLPCLPKLYGLILKEMQSPEASLKKVGEIISQDVSMSTKILKLVNSAFFGLPQRITDPQQATVYLGIETLKALVLSIHVFSSFTKKAEFLEFSLEEMWRHNLMVGRLARDIARAELAERNVAEEALIAGILHDIGKLILLKVPDQYKEVMNFIEKTGSDFVEAEYVVMKTSHAELGAYLLGLWGIPDSIVEIVAFHHEPSKLIENVFTTLSNHSDKTVDKTKPTGGILKSRSTKKFLKGLTALTAVHVANALVMQKDCTPDTTTFPYVDMLYLRTLNLADKLPEWVECYSNLMQ